MLDELVVEDLEADTVPGLDIVSASAVVGDGTLVAAQVIAEAASSALTLIVVGYTHELTISVKDGM